METEYKVACRTRFLGEWRYARGERGARESGAFTSRAFLALHPRFVPKKIAAILQAAKKIKEWCRREGGDSIVFQLRLLTHSACQCDVTQQRVSASRRFCRLAWDAIEEIAWDHAFSLLSLLCLSREEGMVHFFVGTHVKKPESGHFSDWIGNNTDDLRCSDWPKCSHPLVVVDFNVHFCLRNEQWIHTRVDVTKPGNWERGAGNWERKSGNDLSAVTYTKIQNGGMTAEKWQRGTGNNRQEHTTCKEEKTWLVSLYCQHKWI